MAEQINHKGVSGHFIPISEWESFKRDVEAHNQRVRALEKEVEIARGESKYKLKKLARIIERKDKQLSLLKANVQEK